MQEILRRALERQSSREGEISHDELVDAAREAGIDPVAVEHAANELSANRSIVDDDAARVARSRRAFFRHLTVFAVVNTALAGLDLLTTGGVWWFAIAILWGIGLALHGMSVFFPKKEAPEERALRLEKQAIREAKAAEIAAVRAKKHAKREARRQRKAAIRHGAEQFENAVEQGVALLLNGIAKQVQRGVDHATREFGDDEAGRDESGPIGAHPHDDARLRAAGVDRVAPPPSLVRVEVDRAEHSSGDTHEIESDEDRRQRARLRR